MPWLEHQMNPSLVLDHVLLSACSRMIKMNGASRQQPPCSPQDGTGHRTLVPISGKFSSNLTSKPSCSLILRLSCNDWCNRLWLSIWASLSPIFTTCCFSKLLVSSAQVLVGTLRQLTSSFLPCLISRIAIKQWFQTFVTGQIPSQERHPNGLTHALHLLDQVSSHLRIGRSQVHSPITLCSEELLLMERDVGNSPSGPSGHHMSLKWVLTCSKTTSWTHPLTPPSLSTSSRLAYESPILP